MNSFLSTLRRLLSRLSIRSAPIPEPSSSGPSAPSASSRTSTPYAETPASALAAFVPKASSTEAKGNEMTFSLTAIATAVADAVSVASAASTAVTAVLKAAASMMEGVESAYEGVENAGGTKLAAVMAGASVVAGSLGQDWDTVKADVSAVVSAAKAVYNAATGAAASTPAAVPSPAAAPTPVEPAATA